MPHSNPVRYSIVIPAYNEAGNIGRCLNSIAGNADAAGVEILILDNHSTDNTRDEAERLGATVIKPEQRLTIAGLRNLGAERAAGAFLLFLDADMEVPSDWMEKITDHFENRGTDVLGFVERIPDEAPWFARIWSLRTMARRDRLMAVDFLPGRNISIAKTYYDRVGGFDTTLVTSEDKDFVMRLRAAGATVMSDPSADIFHWGYEKTFAELLRKEFWRQHSHVSMLLRHGIRPRLLRFPLLSLAHLFWPVIILVLLFAGHGGWALTAFAVWFMPSWLLTIRHEVSRSPVLRQAQFTFLYWVRFIVAGASVLDEGFRLLFAKR